MSNLERDHPFVRGHLYTKNDIYRLLNIPQSQQGGNWNTGYHKYDGTWFIFTNVGTSGRTGHDYENGWRGEDFHWTGRTQSQLHHESIQDLLDPRSRVLLFWREESRAPFKFAGQTFARMVRPTIPVTVIWGIYEETPHPVELMPDELLASTDPVLFEGARVQITVNAFERNPVARRQCIEHHGWQCAVCDMTFEERYGEIGKDFIHVHHLRPLSTLDGQDQVDPITDLRPVCANCHAMLHRDEPPLSIAELRRMIRRSSLIGPRS